MLADIHVLCVLRLTLKMKGMQEHCKTCIFMYLFFFTIYTDFIDKTTCALFVPQENLGHELKRDNK